MNKTDLTDSLKRMGVAVHPGEKVCKNDVLNMPFAESGLTVSKINPLTTEKHQDRCVQRLHLKISGGDAAAIDEVVGKNLGDVEKKLTEFFANQSGGAIGPVKLEVHARNDENLWCNLHFYYNLQSFLNSALDTFCYHLVERG